MRPLGPVKTVRVCFVEGCESNATVRVVSPGDPYDLRLACRKCRDELCALYGWEAVR